MEERPDTTTPSNPPSQHAALRAVEFRPPDPGPNSAPRARDTGEDATDLARGAVFRRLAKDIRAYPEFDLRPIDEEGMSPLDAAFAHALHDAVVRHWLTLDYLLGHHSQQPWERVEVKVKAVLFAGAAQILFMDKVPARAAVHSSVEFAKRRIRAGAGSMVNAILRRISEEVLPGTEITRDTWSGADDEIPLADGRALVLANTKLPADPLERLAIATSHPFELLRHWLKNMPMREVRRIAHHGAASPPIILNTQHASAPVPGYLAKPHTAPGHSVFTGTRSELLALLHERDDVWVQDPASSLAAMSVADLKPSLVIDACAGQGTKTRQLAATFPDAKIIATDVSDRRREALAKTFAGSEQVEIVLYKHLAKYAGMADLVLLDAPCSNTGVLARRVEARYRISGKTLDSLAATQRQILADSIRWLSPGGGRILYSTCSLEPEENEEQLKWLDRWHAMRASRTNRRLPEGGPGQPPENYSDGSFAALAGA